MEWTMGDTILYTHKDKSMAYIYTFFIYIYDISQNTVI